MKPYQEVPISELTPDPHNAVEHDEANIRAIMESLRKFGQQKPIVVTRNHIVVAGNGTLIAARRLGWVSIEVRYSELSGDDLTAYALADNSTARLATWKTPELSRHLDHLKMKGWDMPAFGFSREDTLNLFEEVPADDDTETHSQDGRGYKDKLEDYVRSSIREIKLHFEEEEYHMVMERLAELREQHGVKDNSELLKVFLGLPT